MPTPLPPAFMFNFIQEELKEVQIFFFSYLEIDLFSKTLHHYSLSLGGRKGGEKWGIFGG